jgi:photosystem II stability/assembly factor-like uncharacterized protein
MAIEGSVLRNPVASRVTARSAVVVATMIVAGGCGGSATGPAPGPPPPATILIEKLGTDPVHIVAGDPFPDSIRVLVHDGSGAPRAGQTVTFAVRTGGGSVSPSTVTTGADGRAAGRFITGTLVEQNTATASLPSGKSVSFSTSTIPGPAAAISFSGAPVIVLDSGASSTLEATVQDRNGNAIPGAPLHLTVRDGVTASVSGTKVDPNDARVVYASVTDVYHANSSQTGIFKSLDGGQSWSRLAKFAVATQAVRLAMSNGKPAMLYANVQSPDLSASLWLSGDGGATWSKRAASGGGPGLGDVLAVDPSNGAVVYVGGVNLFVSRDSGSTFTQIAQSNHVDNRGFAFGGTTGQRMYAGTDGGIYRSSDGGRTWADINANLVLTEFYPGAAMERAHPAHVLAGSQDNGIDEYTGSVQWEIVGGGDGGAVAIDWQDPSTEYGEIQWDPPYGGPIRREGAGWFTEKANGIDLSQRAGWEPPLVMDPIDPRVLYFGTSRLYRTRDRADHWTALSTDLSKGTGIISAVAIAPRDTTTIWVGTSDGNVQVSRDYGETWSLVSRELPNRYVTHIAPDPDDAASAYVTVSGFGSSHVFRTQDAGQSWTDISGNLPDLPVNAAVSIPGSGELIIGTDLGAFLSGRAGGQWSPVTPALSPLLVIDLAYDVASGTLMLVSRGRGVYTAQIPTTVVLRGDINLDGAVSAVDALAILDAEIGQPVPAGWRALPNGDATCDGRLEALDAQVVLSAAVGLDVKRFCVGTFR